MNLTAYSFLDLLRRILVVRHLNLSGAKNRKRGETHSQPEAAEALASRPVVSVTGGPEGRRRTGGERKRREIAIREGRSETDNPGWFVGGPITNPGRVPLIPMNKALIGGASAGLCPSLSALLKSKIGGRTWKP